MLLVCCCSTTPACYSHYQYQILSHVGIRALSPLGKAAGIRGIVEDKFALGITDRVHSREVSFKTQATKFLYSHVIERPEMSDCMEFNNIIPNQDELDDIELLFSNKWSDSMGSSIEPCIVGSGDLNYVQNACITSPEDKLLTVSDQIAYSTNLSSETAVRATILTVDAKVDVAPSTPTSLSDSLAGDSLANLKTSMENFLSVVSSSVDASVGKGDLFMKNTLDALTSPLRDTSKSVREALDNVVNGLLSNADSSVELAGNQLTGFSADLKKSMSKVGVVSIDVLRRTIVTLEDFIASVINLILYYYGSAKELFPPEVRDVLNLTESKAIEILGPVASVFKQVYNAIEVLESNIGLDPNDPVVPLFFFLGTSVTLGIFYWALAYGGYSGDLSPQITLELLTGEKDVVLIDIRPEDLRERDGVPDLRRGARFKYASITLPEVDGSVRKLIKRERDLNDSLTAAVIRNLKIVQGRSKVIILDADGTRSKSIARSLRKLGVKKPYLVQGGFQSWVKNGLRIKAPKPETTFTLLNEEADAILEDIRPTPLQIAGYSVGFVAAGYALSEWEKTLQFVGLIGIGQTIYRRLASYEDSEDFQQDVRLLLGPFRFGSMAFSWAAGKLEPNRIGLPTSPSSSDVQSRVLQAAAKHESQPSDSEEAQESSQEFAFAANEKEDPSES